MLHGRKSQRFGAEAATLGPFAGEINGRISDRRFRRAECRRQSRNGTFLSRPALACRTRWPWLDLGTTRLGDALTCTPATGSEVLVSRTVDIRFFPSNSDFNRALKLALGRLRNSAAMRTSGSISASTFAHPAIGLRQHSPRQPGSAARFFSGRASRHRPYPDLESA